MEDYRLDVATMDDVDAEVDYVDAVGLNGSAPILSTT